MIDPAHTIRQRAEIQQRCTARKAAVAEVPDVLAAPHCRQRCAVGKGDPFDGNETLRKRDTSQRTAISKCAFTQHPDLVQIDIGKALAADAAGKNQDIIRQGDAF